MSEQRPITYEEMLEFYRLLIRERQEQRIDDERRRAEFKELEAKWRADREELEMYRRAAEHEKRIAVLRENKISEKRRNREPRIHEINGKKVFRRGKLWNKFKDLGYELEWCEIHSGFVNIELGISEGHSIWMASKKDAILIALSTYLSTADIEKHIEKLKKYRCDSDARGGHQRVIGGIAGIVTEDSVLQFARENGMYTIVQSGKVFDIVVPEGFKPKEW